MKKAALHNLGCKVNAYETEAMQQILEAAGYEIVPFTEKADVYVINTCSVTNMADRKSRQMLHKAKKTNPKAIVVAAGCYVQTKEAESSLDESIDIVIGNNKKHELVELIEKYERNRLTEETKEPKKTKSVVDINHEKQEYEKLRIEKTAEHTRAFLKVQDGCNQFCSYCIIPFARGRVRSRKAEDVLEEVKRLAKRGVKEVVLTGIHLSSYGVDTGDHLLHLIEMVHEVEEIKRIRLGSLEPRIVTEEFVKRISQLEKICPHFHLSLQSGCDTVLARMNRRYDTAEYEAGCDLLRKYFVHPAITTDVIVGFPGETEEEFQITKEYLERIHFYEMHIFKYSKREGTKAAVMADQVLEQEKTRRSGILLELEKKMSEEFRNDYLGKQVTVLLEEEVELDGKTYFTGYTKEYVKVAYETGKDMTNQFITGTIQKQLTGDIYLLVEF
ncbi:MAG: tRNA (N(6)-L-threonylcarbamoyladenosine(37)-C(2))-methylthiotransferase MtaB [Clostridiales bacterium]|nr:tRNA (N(6)-L-threonylcarbamoyladenosine(37)-C(2))-methylthiotransferase MtaB [Clostridiales bacterium]